MDDHDAVTLEGIGALVNPEHTLKQTSADYGRGHVVVVADLGDDVPSRASFTSEVPSTTLVLKRA